MLTCTSCGAQHPDDVAFCDECGAALTGPQSTTADRHPVSQARTVIASSFCVVCGVQVLPDDPFCANCGASQGGSAKVADVSVSQAQGQTVVSQAVEPAAGPSQAALDDLVCSHCGASLAPDSIFCDMCGAKVTPEEAELPPAQRPGAPSVSKPGSGTDGIDSILPPPLAHTPEPPPAYNVPPPPQQPRFVVLSSHAVLPLPPRRVEVVIGREDPVSGIFPEIDLTDHGGDEGGVSRKHARVLPQGDRFVIQDLNSVNYTFVNGERLAPGQQRVIEDGDQVSFGRVKVVFRTR